MSTTLILAEIFLMLAGAFMGVGVLFAFAGVIGYCLGVFDE